jgi:hypothetical protein
LSFRCPNCPSTFRWRNDPRVVISKAQGFLGEELSIYLAVGDFSRVGCDLFYQRKKADGSELARAKTGIVFLIPRARWCARCR